MDNELIQIQHYITASLADSAFYTELSKDAPTEEYRLILTDIAADKCRHTDLLKDMYRSITQKGYAPPAPPPIINNSFQEMLKSRVLRENEEYGTYMNEALKRNDTAERNMFMRFAADDNANSVKLLYMLSRY